MKTEKEIREKRKELDDRINLSLDASELGEDIVGEGAELSHTDLMTRVAMSQILGWVLEETHGPVGLGGLG